MGQTDLRTDGQIATLLNAPCGRSIISTVMLWNEWCTWVWLYSLGYRWEVMCVHVCRSYCRHRSWRCSSDSDGRDFNYRCLLYSSTKTSKVSMLLTPSWFLTRRFIFYPRDAMLARVLARALCLCPSVTSRCSVEMDGGNNLVFGVGTGGLLSTSRALYSNSKD